jgi:broad specificity phosphatase PhoE
MKIYILRHEDRTIDCTFFAPLTKKGLDNSVKLINYLKPLDITDIYCSPFIRTLQTIEPYVKATKKKLKIEYGLMEIKNENIIPPRSHNVELPIYIADFFNYDPTYDTYIDTNDIKYPENEFNLEVRVKKFLKHLINENYRTDKNILLVTHQGICKVILKILNKFCESCLLTPEALNNYPLGSLSLIFDRDNWIYKKIN